MFKPIAFVLVIFFGAAAGAAPVHAKRRAAAPAGVCHDSACPPKGKACSCHPEDNGQQSCFPTSDQCEADAAAKRSK